MKRPSGIASRRPSSALLSLGARKQQARAAIEGEWRFRESSSVVKDRSPGSYESMRALIRYICSLLSRPRRPHYFLQIIPRHSKALGSRGGISSDSNIGEYPKRSSRPEAAAFSLSPRALAALLLGLLRGSLSWGLEEARRPGRSSWRGLRSAKREIFKLYYKNEGREAASNREYHGREWNTGKRK